MRKGCLIRYEKNGGTARRCLFTIPGKPEGGSQHSPPPSGRGLKLRYVLEALEHLPFFDAKYVTRLYPHFTFDSILSFTYQTKTSRKISKILPGSLNPVSKIGKYLPNFMRFKSFHQRKLLSYKTFYHERRGAVLRSAVANAMFC